MGALEERALFAAVSSALAGATDLRPALRRCLAVSAEWTDSARATLWMLDGDLLRPVLSYGELPLPAPAPGPLQRHPAASAALAEGGPVSVTGPQGTYVTVLPLPAQGRHSGVLTLERAGGAPDEDRVATLARVSGAFAMCGHQIQALDDAQRAAAQLDTLHTIARQITAATALDETLGLVVEQAAAVLGAASARLWLVAEDDPNTLVMAAVAGSSPVAVGTRRPAEIGLSGWVFLHGRPLLVHEASARVAEPVEAVDAASPSAGSESVAGVCLRHGDGSALGVLAVLDAAPYRFTRTDLATLERLAEHAALAIDTHALIERERQEAARLRLLQRAVEQVGDGIALIGEDGRLAWANATYAQLHGYTPEELVGRKVRDLLEADPSDEVTAIAARLGVGEVRRIEALRRRRDGSTWPAAVTLTGYGDPDGRRVGIVSTLHDITARVQLEEQLRAAALTDALTGLPNRAGLTSHLDKASRPPAAVLFVDLDDFKTVNDTYGHAVGDEVLVAAAHRIRSCLRPADLLARLGGDEFVVVLHEFGPSRGADHVAARIRAALGHPARLGTHTIRATGTVGIAIPRPGESIQALIDRADQAMYARKRGVG